MAHHKTAPAAADERPTAQRADCLWLLDFSPDQVHSAPLRGPLIGRRTTAAPSGLPFVRSERRASQRGGVHAKVPYLTSDLIGPAAGNSRPTEMVCLARQRRARSANRPSGLPGCRWACPLSAPMVLRFAGDTSHAATGTADRAAIARATSGNPSDTQRARRAIFPARR